MAINVRDFGAVGDGMADDRAAIQRAIDAGAGGVVWIPEGVYLLGQGAGAWCLTVPANTTLAGANTNTVLKQRGGIGANVRTLQVSAPNVQLLTMTLDGNASIQSKDEHRAGLFALGAIGLVVQGVTSINHTGDGFYISIGSNDVSITGCTATGNQRNGLTFGGGTTGGNVTGCKLTGNAIQQLDTEPGSGFHVDGVTVARCIIGRGRGDYAMTVAGSGQAWRSRGWVIEDNEFDGSLEIVWSDDITVLRNHSTNSTDKPSLQVYRACNRITVGYNSFVLSGPASAVIAVTGTGLDQAPDRVVIDSNIIRSSDPGAHGVHITCARNTLVCDNAIVGAGVPDLYAAGVYARTTVTEEPIQSVVVRDNQISNWGKYGVALGGNGDAIIRRVDVSDNIFDDASTPHTMTSAMALPVAQTVSISNNVLLGGCVTELAVTPPGRLVPTNGLSWVP